MANQTLENLKRIHQLQKDGEIIEILRELRSSKSKVSALSEKLYQRNKFISEKLKEEQNSQKFDLNEKE